MGVYIWTVARDYTNGRIAIDDSKGAMSVAILKVNDGLDYQPYSPEDSAQWANDVYRPQGIDFHPWGVGRGFSLAGARDEGRLAGRHAAASGSEYHLDLEPYKNEYWQGIPGSGKAFCDGYAETSNGIKLRITPDARNVGINLEEFASHPIVSAWHPQMYWAAFNEPMALWVRNGINPLLNAGVPKSRIYPLLAVWREVAGEPPIPADELERDILNVAEDGYAGVALWRRGVMSSPQVERLLLMESPFQPPPPEPEPGPPPYDKEAMLKHTQAIRRENDALEKMVQELP